MFTSPQPFRGEFLYQGRRRNLLKICICHPCTLTSKVYTPITTSKHAAQHQSHFATSEGQPPVMDRFGTLTQLCIAVALLGGVCHCWEAYIREPVYAVRGSCVLVPCSTVSYSDVKWYAYRRASYPVVYSSDRSEIMDQFKGRTSVPNTYNGDCTLKIDNVRQQDGEEDLYVWVWKYFGEDKGFYDRTIKINILDPVRPQMFVANTQVEGKPFTATCRFRHSCPSAPPQMYWQGLSPTSNELTHTKDAQGLWVTEATATFKVTRQNQGTRLNCWIALNGLESGSIWLDILYAPMDVKVDYTGSTTVVEGNEISLRCTSNSRPTPTHYEWLVTQNSNTIRHTGNTILLRDVRRRTSVSCIATNSVGHGESKQISLDVHYAPMDVKVDYTGSTTVVEGNEISLRCTSNSRPTPTHYEWLVTQNSNTIRHTGNTILLRDVRRRTSVSCIATNSVGHGESKQISLDVHYAPMDVKVDYTGSTTVVEGNEISLRCTSDSRPTPTHYEWLVTQNNTARHYKVLTLVLRDVRRDTSVSCIANNSVGHGESKQLSLNVHYSPSIMPGLFCSTQNRKLECVCQAEANPSAVISWTVDGSKAVFPPFNTTTQHNGSVTVSELTGPQGYNVTCRATNSVGTEFTQILVQSEGDTSAVFVVVGASAGVCVIVGLAVTVLVIWKKRRRAVPPGGLSTAQHVTDNKTCYVYNLESDEDLYVNAVHGEQVYEDQDAESCIYQNYEGS
ncbi:hypothetical protein AMELA_G00226030 [Ameiurus melas]|uniref:Ig-like domain-containing protein n=1 Tax=Ameiurus melas TaxID=219545 RepID=A0A7J6A3L0_AMEME|nr:hypothetical protein AMELA_G00226030 [Ameiurus melas]